MEQNTLRMVAVLAAIGSLVATAANAQSSSWMPPIPKNGYVRAEGGWNNTDDNHYGTSAGRISNKYKEGYMAGVAVGAQNGPWRYEAEAFQNTAKVKAQSLNGAARSGADGSMKLGALMGNAYYDFGQARIKPYIGGGIGVGRLNVDSQRSAGTTFSDDSDTVLAYQGMAGVKYDLNPCWSVNAEYRYIGANDGDIQTLGGGKSKVAYDSNNIIVGLTYKF